MNSVLLSVKLPGRLTGPKKHFEYQIVTVDVTAVGAKAKEFMTRKIKHNDRVDSDCSKKMKFSEESVRDMENSECPHWETPSKWKSMSKYQKLVSHLKRYDEGYGITIDIFEN